MIKLYFIPFFLLHINCVLWKVVLNVNYVHVSCFACKYTCIKFIWHYIYITFYFGNVILLAVHLHIRVKSIKLIVARLFGGKPILLVLFTILENLIVVISHYVYKYHPFLSMQTVSYPKVLHRACVGFRIILEEFVGESIKECRPTITFICKL